MRRSFASLLRHDLALSGIPRDPRKPAYFPNFGLSRDDDAALTAWMRDRLQIAVRPTDGARVLRTFELAVLQVWNPPINIADVNDQWRPTLSRERKAMADQARQWQPPAAARA